ncbi:hypothetical protein ACRBEV_11480 [Methylobacterium phyllosphaerae]
MRAIGVAPEQSNRRQSSNNQERQGQHVFNALGILLKPLDQDAAGREHDC